MAESQLLSYYSNIPILMLILMPILIGISGTVKPGSNYKSMTGQIRVIRVNP